MLKYLLEHVLSVILTISVTSVAYYFRNQLFELYRNLFYGRFIDKGDHKSYTYNQVFAGNLMDVSKIKIVLDKEKYSLAKSLPDYAMYEQIEKAFRFYAYQAKLKGVRLFNGSVSRLCAYQRDGERLTITAQELDYFDYVKGHLLPDIKLKNKKHRTFRQYLNENPDVFSKLPRNIGVSFLLITKDEKIVLQHRSKKTVINPGTVAPSASGVVQYSDILLMLNEKVRKQDIFGKELFDEIGVLPMDITSMQLLGIYEDELRLKSPGLFFIVNCNKSFDQIKNRYKKEPRDKFETVTIFSKTIDDFHNLKKEKNRLSGTIMVYLYDTDWITGQTSQ